MFICDEGFWVGLVDNQLHRLSLASIMLDAQQIKPLSNVMQRQLILLCPLAKSGRFTLQQLSLQRIQLKLHLALHRVEKVYDGIVSGWIGRYGGTEALCLDVFHTEMHIHRDLHRHGEVVGAVEEGLCDLGRHCRVAALVDALVVMATVIANSVVGVIHIAHVVIAELDFVGHEDEVEAVVQATAREAFIRVAAR